MRFVNLLVRYFSVGYSKEIVDLYFLFFFLFVLEFLVQITPCVEKEDDKSKAQGCCLDIDSTFFLNMIE